MPQLTTDQLQLKVKKIVKPYLGQGRKPTLNEARSKVEDLIRKSLNGEMTETDLSLKHELEDLAPLRELSRLLTI